MCERAHTAWKKGLTYGLILTRQGTYKIQSAHINGYTITNAVQYTTNMAAIHLTRHIMARRLYVPVEILLVEVGCITMMTLKLFGTGMLLEGRILLTTPLMR